MGSQGVPPEIFTKLSVGFGAEAIREWPEHKFAKNGSTCSIVPTPGGPPVVAPQKAGMPRRAKIIYIGQFSALSIALGIGAALASAPGSAVADSGGNSSPSSSAQGSRASDSSSGSTSRSPSQSRRAPQSSRSDRLRASNSSRNSVSRPSRNSSADRRDTDESTAAATNRRSTRATQLSKDEDAESSALAADAAEAEALSISDRIDDTEDSGSEAQTSAVCNRCQQLCECVSD